MVFKVIILDFDGTIVESNSVKDEAFRALFKEYPQYLPEIMNYHFAHNAVIRYEKFKYITEEILGKSYTKKIEKEMSEEFSRYVFEGTLKCPYVKGAREFLDRVYGKTPLYLASINPAEDLEKILISKGIRKYFKKIYANPWIKTDSIKNIMAEEGFSCDEVTFIGDTMEDYNCALQANVFFIGRQDKNKTFPFAIDAPIYEDFIGISDFLQNRAGLQ